MYVSTVTTRFDIPTLSTSNIVLSYYSTLKNSFTLDLGSKNRMPRVVPSLGSLRSECFVKFCASNSSFIFWSLSLEVFLIVRDSCVISNDGSKILRLCKGDEIFVN